MLIEEYSIIVMEIIRTVKEMQKYSAELRKNGKTVALVPTMGYLHKGHLSLVGAACRDNDAVVVSIFVNPTQFTQSDDLSTYPRNFERDATLLKQEKVDAIFYPEVAEIYPEPSLTSIYVHRLSDVLCGKHRPGHFDGVCLIVAKLFNIVNPHRAYFGAKDFQQLAIIRRMSKDLNFNIEIVTCPIVREVDGLAMSSRNIYLDKDERARALILNQALSKAEAMINLGERGTKKILAVLKKMIEEKTPSKIDYISAVDPETLQDIEVVTGSVLFALAVKFGKARLIDNRLIVIQ